MKISEIEQRKILEGFKARFVHTESFTIAFWEIDKNASLPEHTHIQEQTTQVTKGKLQMTIDGKTEVLEEGMIIAIPPNVPHSGIALSDCELIDTFCPVREDFK